MGFKFCVYEQVCVFVSAFNFKWNFKPIKYVLQAIICGRVGQAPVQKILRNGRTVTIFTVGTGGMFDQRITMNFDTPKPAQWHRIAVHNDTLEKYAVQQITKKYVFMLDAI